MRDKKQAVRREGRIKHRSGNEQNSCYHSLRVLYSHHIESCPLRIPRTPTHRRFPTPHLKPSSEPSCAGPINYKLICKIRITARLKDATQLERPGYNLLTQKEIAHLHAVAGHPIEYNGGTKALAGFSSVVFQDLGDRENSFDGESGVAQEGDIEGGGGEGRKDHLNEEEEADEIGEEKIVAALLVSGCGWKKGRGRTYGRAFPQRQKFIGRCPFTISSRIP